MEASKEEILNKNVSTITFGKLIGTPKEQVFAAMEQYASLWQQKYNDLKSRYDQMDADTTKASTYAAEAYERLHKQYEELKGKAGKMVDALKKAKPFVNQCILSDQTKLASGTLKSGSAHADSIKYKKELLTEIDQALQDWGKGEGV